MHVDHVVERGGLRGRHIDCLVGLLASAWRGSVRNRSSWVDFGFSFHFRSDINYPVGRHERERSWGLVLYSWLGRLTRAFIDRAVNAEKNS